MRAEQSRHHLVFAIYFMTDLVCRDTTLGTNSELNIPKCRISAGQCSFAFRGEKEYNLKFSKNNNFTCRVGNSETSFEVKTGVRQGCTMSAMLFNMTIDWVTRRTTEDQSGGIRWTLFSTL